MISLSEIFNTECYTLIDALIWAAWGFGLAYGLFGPDHLKRRRKK